MADKHKTLGKVMKQINLEGSKMKRIATGKVDKPVSTQVIKLTDTSHQISVHPIRAFTRKILMTWQQISSYVVF